jgi:hypothetical protein
MVFADGTIHLGGVPSAVSLLLPSVMEPLHHAARNAGKVPGTEVG